MLASERRDCEHGAPQNFIFEFSNFFPIFLPKIEENLLFKVSFVTYDCVSYNRGLCGIFFVVAEIFICYRVKLSKSSINFEHLIVPLQQRNCQMLGVQ